MSLIIATVVKDGLVVAADTRTTCKDSENHCRYSDDAEKLIPFPNKVVVMHCGDAQVNNKLTVKKFLYDLRKEVGKDTKITDLPLQLLNSYIDKGGCQSTTFLICGVILDEIIVYAVDTITKEVKIVIKNTYGATYRGITKIAHVIMDSGIIYDNLTLDEAIELTKNCLEENIFLSKFNKEQSIGGKCQVYVIDLAHYKLGWLQEDGTLREDENANPNAFEEWRLVELDKFNKNM